MLDLSAHEHGQVVYLDNAATVYPKPPAVLDRVMEIYKNYGVNPGRSGYDLCSTGSEIVETTRRQLTDFFGGSDANRLCFAYNASDALNTLIQGVLLPGDHVVSTVLEHNSVLRPLNHLARDGGIEVNFAPCNAEGYVEPDEIEARIKANTRLVICTHASNVLGTVQPLAAIGAMCRERQLLFMTDTSQSAGVIPVDAARMGLSALAFTGHKSLLAPTGIGGLYVAEDVEIRPTRFGGTGIRSAEPFHLPDYPWRLEIGTLNTLGVVGLHLAQDYLAERGIGAIYAHEMKLLARLQDGLSQVRGVQQVGTDSLEERIPVMSINVQGMDASEVGEWLDADHHIAVRTGLHCSPLTHEAMGTAPRGAVRLSIGPSNTPEDIDKAVGAMDEIAFAAQKR